MTQNLARRSDPDLKKGGGKWTPAFPGGGPTLLDPSHRPCSAHDSSVLTVK